MSEQVQEPVEALGRLSFFVPGIPRPQGSKRHVGGGRMVEQSKYVDGWRRMVTTAAVAAAGGRAFARSTAVSVLLDFYIPRGKTVRRLLPTVTPDTDKLARAVADSLTKARVWGDDAQMVGLHAVKRYEDGDHGPGVQVTILELA